MDLQLDERPVVQSRPFQAAIIDGKPQRLYEMQVRPVWLLAIFPVLGGISGSTKTIWIAIKFPPVTSYYSIILRFTEKSQQAGC